METWEKYKGKKFSLGDNWHLGFKEIKTEEDFIFVRDNLLNTKYEQIKSDNDLKYGGLPPEEASDAYNQFIGMVNKEINYVKTNSIESLQDLLNNNAAYVSHTKDEKLIDEQKSLEYIDHDNIFKSYVEGVSEYDQFVKSFVLTKLSKIVKFKDIWNFIKMYARNEENSVSENDKKQLRDVLEKW